MARIQQMLRAIAATVDRRDVLLGAGLALLSLGAGMIAAPFAAIVPGAIITWLAIHSNRSDA